MSLLRSRLSSRVRLALVAASVLLISAVLAAPEVSQAKPASVKLFTAHIAPDVADGGVAGAWNETVHNCGLNDTDTPCNRSSTIGLAFVRVAVPSAFQTSDFTVSIQSASGHNWNASYSATTHLITAQANTGSDKLQAGESVVIHSTATPQCTSGIYQFSTQAWGDFSFGDQFTVAGTTNTVANPAVTISGCALAPGGSVTDPTGTQTETVDGDFAGTLNVAFGGNLSCSSDAQWAAGYQLPYQVTISPGPGFISHDTDGPKTSTSTFDPTVAGDSSIAGDSSWYRICYSQDPNATMGQILEPCYAGGGVVNDPPCVDHQERIFGTNLISITILLPKEDPAKH